MHCANPRAVIYNAALHAQMLCKTRELTCHSSSRVDVATVVCSDPLTAGLGKHVEEVNNVTQLMR